MYRVSVLLLVAIFFFPGSLSAEEYSLEWGKGTEIHEKEEALNTLFLYAVVEGALNIIGVSLEDKQRQAIFYFFKDSFLEYIESYTEINSGSNKNSLITSKERLSLNIFVNKKKIEKELQEIGLFYTKSTRLQYELVGELSISEEELSFLEAIFGLVQVPSSPVKLFFWKEQESRYSGILSWDTNRYSYNNLSLRMLWISLWREYWKKEKGIQKEIIRYEVEVSGLKNQNEISSLMRSFEQYSSVLYDIKLEKLDLVEEGYLIKWVFIIKDEASFISVVRKTLLEYASASYKVTKQQ